MRMNEKGMALVTIIMVALVLLTMGTALIMRANFELRHAAQDTVNQQAYYAARSATNYGVAVASVMVNNRTIGDTDTTLVIDLPGTFLSTYDFFSDAAWTAPGIQVHVGAADTVPLDNRSQFGGLSSFVRTIDVTGRARGITQERALVNQESQVQQLPVFEFATLYDDDLYFVKPIGLGGKFHTNSNFYLNPAAGDPSSFVNIRDVETVITAAGRFYQGGSGDAYVTRVDGDPTAAFNTPLNWMDVTQGTWWNAVLPASDPSTNYNAGRMNIYEGLIKDKAHGIRAVQTPLDDNYDLIDEYGADGLYYQATMRIETVPRDFDAIAGRPGALPDTTKIWLPADPNAAGPVMTDVWYQLQKDEVFMDEQLLRHKELQGTDAFSSVWRTPAHIMNKWTFNLSATFSATTKIKVCHIPPGNRGRAHEINISGSGARAHQAHGCYLGPCCGLCIGGGTGATIGDSYGNIVGWSTNGCTQP